MNLQSMVKLCGGSFVIGLLAGLVFGSGVSGLLVALMGGALWSIWCSMESEKEQALRKYVEASAEHIKRAVIIDMPQVEFNN